MKSSVGHKATHHFKSHKVSSLLLAFTVPFFLCGLIKAVSGEYAGIMEWVGSPFGAITLLAFLSVGMFQSRHSMNEIIIDYISPEASASFFSKLNTLVCLVFWLIGVLAVLKIWLGA